MRARRDSWTLSFALAAAVGLSCAKKDEGETPPPEDTSEAAATAVLALDLWDGVPPLAAQPDDIATKLVPRPEPLRPPSVHETIELPLEAPEDTTGEPPIPAEPGPLKIERHGPTGRQDLVDAVRLSFNQPMVPLADVAALKAATIPFTVEPAVPGEIDWLGTRTLAFMPEAGRMPYSTEYTVTVPAGVVSTWGEALASEYRWKFSTPKLSLESSSPWSGSRQVELEPTITLVFNQPIERTALVGAMTLVGKGDRMALKLAPVPKPAAGVVSGEPEWKAERRVQVVPERKLRPNTRYKLSIPRGVYGEGPLESDAISLSFDTYPPLTVKRQSCWGKCWANQGLVLEASTELSDPDVASKVHVSPEPANFAVSASWSSISLSGDFEGRTRYTITVDAGLRDIHGQTLARDFTTKVTMGPPYPSVSLATAASDPVVIESAAAKDLGLVVAGVKTLELQARALDIAELPSFLDAYPSDDRGWPSRHAAPTYTKLIGTPDAMKRTERISLDLGPALARGAAKGDGHLWLNLRSNPVTIDRWTERYGTNMMVEVTDLALAAAIDNDSGLVMVTRLSNGEPVVGAKVSLHHGTGKVSAWTDVTDAAGLARMTTAPPSGTISFLVVEHEGDSALLRLDRNDVRGRWRWTNAAAPDETARAFFYTDRTPYKPGDTVHLAGILRRETHGPEGHVELWRTDFTAEYRVTNPRGVEVAKGTTKVGKLGTFTVDIPTTEAHGTGDFQFVLTVGQLLGSDHDFYHSFPVETYRAPEFTVEVERPTSTALVFGGELEAEIRGRYLHGAPLSGGEVSYVLRRSETGFTPPGSLNEGFTFGIDQGYGYGGYGYGYGGYGYGGYGYGGRRGGYGGYVQSYGGGTVVAQGPGELDANGVMTVKHALLAVEPLPEGTPAPTVPPATKTKPEDEGPPSPATFTLEATVVDDNRQAISGTGSFVVHAAEVYVGMRAEQKVLREGERAKLEAVVVDLEGERVLGHDLVLTLLRRDTTRKAVERDGRWVYETETTHVEAGGCPLTSALVPAKCELDVGKAGTYVVRGTAKDEAGHPTRSEMQLYVYGKDAVVSETTERRVDLVPDRREYQPGDTATVLVRSPFDTARGVVVVEREGIALELPVVVEGGAATVEIPVTASMIPAVSISAMLTRGRVEVPGAPKGQDLGMPAVATGQVQLVVSTDEKKIAVALEPSARELAPGETMKLTLTTSSVDGEALPAAVAVMVVDEGVLSLMGHQTPDPLAFFHHVRSDDVWLYALHASVLARDVAPAPVGGPPTTTTGASIEERSEGNIGLGSLGLIGMGAGGGGSGYGRGSGGDAYPDVPAMAAPGEPMADAKKEYKAKSPAKPKAARRMTTASAALLDPAQAMAQPISLREVFATTAYWQAEVLTDAAGQATIEIPMPENLTTFRVMAVAVDPAQADRFGKGDTTVRVRKPLMLRPSLPRFANYGDHFEASVMVDNQTGEDQAVLVGTRGLNVSLPGESQKLLQIPAGESSEVRFPMQTVEVGTMRLQFAALSNGGRDATELELPVHYPATADAFADYGMIEGATQRTIVPPPDALPAFGGLEISMSSTALSGLQDAVEYLVTYPYECAEQTASRVLPIFALSKILDEFPVASLRDRIYRDNLANQGIERLLAKQNYDGGFGYWTSNESWPYLTNWVTLALLEGKAAGYSVKEESLRKALNYIENFVAHGHVTRWGTYYDHTSRALGLWILSGEKRGAALFDRVWSHRKEVPLYARALLMAAAHRYGRTTARDTVLDELRDAVIESPRALHFAEGKSEAEADGLRVLMHSSVQTDAIALMALLEVVPTDPMLPKVMAGIMSSRDPKQGGRWGTTHANAWALLAADRYYRTVEADEPDYTARIWLDEQLSGQHRFAGRSMTSVEQRLPMAELQGKPERSLVLGKDGPGKLYFRMGLRYAPKDLVMPAEDQGFTVYREYTPLPEADGKPDPSAVQHLPDGSWQVKAGTNVLVTLTIVARDRANYVVVDDALPAGFEGQNPRFVTSVAARADASRTVSTDGWWWPWWSFSHTDMLDDRMLLFADQMPAGVYTYSYTARATNLGTFVLPPVKAEAMYEPERFGHSATSTVRVVE